MSPYRMLTMKTTLILLCMATLSLAADIKCLEPKGGASRLISVSGAPLTHTAQVVGEGADLQTQIDSTLARVDTALQSGGSLLAKAMKLNVYVTQNSATTAVEAALATRFKGEHKPAVSFVTTALPDAKSLVAMDAVGVADGDASKIVAADGIGSRVGKACAVMPVGTRVYISGQAEKGDGTLADATKQTMASLGRTLEFLGLAKKDVIQVKCFLTPMTRCSDAEKKIAAFFEDTKAPPCVFVEWTSTLPIEIEMIVSASSNTKLSKGTVVELRTPPGMTTPTVYSRLTIARHPTTIYTSGLYPTDPKAAPEAQLRSLFTNLKQCLDLGGSDWMHLVKATYYVNDDELNKQHNVVRPDYFSPRRPPAASKAVVAGTGRDGQGITMDFIVVPGEQ
jgi:enamine deaminase RidA (YjgF/YER057c/UK114 family)